MSKLKVGILGCGQISKTYLKNLTGSFADLIDVVAVADVFPAAAQTRAEEFKIPRAATPDELLADPDIQLLVNLTPAPNHYDVTRQILSAGKHCYSEKPLALSMDRGRELVDLAAKSGLRLSVAPDTLLGAGVQTCRKTIDSGAIGRPVAGFGICSIPNAGDRYMSVFRGPLLDLGPYHVGALITLLGPVVAVSGAAQPKRDDPAKPFPPEAITPDAPGNAAAVLEFATGALVTLIATAEYNAYGPELKIWGTDKALLCNDPNNFGGPIQLVVPRQPPTDVPYAFPHADNHRGLGVHEIATALAEGRPQRLGPDLALHTLDVMLAVIDSSKTGRRVPLTTTCHPSPPMPELTPPTPLPAALGATA